MGFEFLIGNWTCEVWGGVFAESWERSDADRLTGYGSHSVDGQVRFREGMTIEPTEDGIVMGIALGSGDGSLKEPVGFVLTAGNETTAQFENQENDFPKIIRYSQVDSDHLHCRIEGGGEPVDFNFVRASLSKFSGS